VNVIARVNSYTRARNGHLGPQNTSLRDGHRAVQRACFYGVGLHFAAVRTGGAGRRRAARNETVRKLRVEEMGVGRGAGQYPQEELRKEKGVRRVNGRVAEWFKAHAWKACGGESLSRVRISPRPSLKCFLRAHLSNRLDEWALCCPGTWGQFVGTIQLDRPPDLSVLRLANALRCVLSSGV
jgi:hypothetical protein